MWETVTSYLPTPDSTTTTTTTTTTTAAPPTTTAQPNTKMWVFDGVLISCWVKPSEKSLVPFVQSEILVNNIGLCMDFYVTTVKTLFLELK